MTNVKAPVGCTENLGKMLRNAREAKGWSDEDLADMMRLDKDIIRRIESGAYLGRQVSVYVRGYFRAYARYVGVQPELVDSYLLKSGLMNIPQKVEPAKFRYEQEQVETHRHLLPWLTGIVVFVVFILVVTWVYWQRTETDNDFAVMPSMQAVLIHQVNKINKINKMGQ